MRPKVFSAVSASACDRLGVGDVADHGRPPCRRRFDLAHDGVGFRFVRAHIDHHRRAGLRQRQRDGAADIAPGAGDDGDSWPASSLSIAHDVLPPQWRKIDLAIVKLRQQLERGGAARLIPAAVARVEHEFLLDVGARQRLAGAAAEMRLTLLDDTAIIEHGADVAGESFRIRIVRIDHVAHFRRQREHGWRRAPPRR